MTAQDTYRPAPIAPLLLLAVIILTLGILGVTNHVRTNAEHTVKHGDVVAEIHRCLEDNGPAQVWRSRSWRQPDTRFLTCEYEPDRWGLMIVQRVKDGWREVTTFVVKSGRLAELVEYLTARAVIGG